VLPKSLDDDFYSYVRSKILPYCVNDVVEITCGVYSGRQGAVVVLDRTAAKPQLLVEFGDGTDELVSVDDLKLIERGDE
jgi:hypothetical protein